MELKFFAASPGVTYQVESSADMINWTTNGFSLTEQDANGMLTATINAGGETLDKFLRVKVYDSRKSP